MQMQPRCESGFRPVEHADATAACLLRIRWHALLPLGLLDLGRRDLLLSFLSQALLPYAPPAKGNRPAAAAGLMAGAKALMQPRWVN